MPDPITTFGAAASALQVADAALRLSRAAYGFLSEIKDAKKDIVALRDALRDAESNVRSLRNYVDEFAKSKNATVEFEVLPETITRALQGFQDDLYVLKDILPADLSPNLATKVKWVFDKKKIKEATKRLDRRKLDVVQAMGSVGLLHQLKIQQDNRSLSTTLQSTSEAVHRQSLQQNRTSQDLLDHSTATRDSQTQILNNLDNQRVAYETTTAQQSLHQAQVTQTLSGITNDTGAIRDSQTQIWNSLRDQRGAQDIAITQQSLYQSQASRVLSDISSDTRAIRGSQTRMVTAVEGMRTSVDTNAARLSRGQTRILRCIENLNISTQHNSTALATSFSASDADMLGRVVRAELKSVLPLILEQSQTKSQTQNEALLCRVNTMIDGISAQLSSNATAAHVFPPNTPPSHPKDGKAPTQAQQGIQWPQLSCPSQSKTAQNPAGFQVARHMIEFQSFRRRWCFKWLIGNLSIDITTASRRRAYSSDASTDFVISIHSGHRKHSSPKLELPFVIPRCQTSGDIIK